MNNVTELHPLTGKTEAEMDLEPGEDTAADMPEIPNPPFHTILEVWREVLKPAAAEALKQPTAQWCVRITSMYDELKIADMVAFRDSYFGKIDHLYQVLLAEIATDAEALTYTEAEVDAEENREHYLNILRDWQVEFLKWELAWDCTAENAIVELAALGECHKMFFGDQGLTAFLDQIGFEFTDEDGAKIVAALDELRGEQ